MRGLKRDQLDKTSRKCVDVIRVEGIGRLIKRQYPTILSEGI